MHLQWLKPLEVHLPQFLVLFMTLLHYQLEEASKLKHFRHFAARYCKTIQAFHSFTALACAWLRLKLYVDTA